ncbi:MAG: hypothetical protein ACRDK7_01000 [Solirubrobacteraceae bacterium]
MPQEISVGTVVTALLTAVVTLGMFILRVHWKRTENHDERLRMLEANHVTKDDVTGIHQRIDGLGEQITRQHTELLKTLIGWRQLP